MFICVRVLLTLFDVGLVVFVFFFQAEDGIRDLVRSRGLGDVYKRQADESEARPLDEAADSGTEDTDTVLDEDASTDTESCLLYTSDAADDLLCVDLGGRRILKKKKLIHTLDKKLQTHHT